MKKSKPRPFRSTAVERERVECPSCGDEVDALYLIQRKNRLRFVSIFEDRETVVDRCAYVCGHCNALNLLFVGALPIFMLSLFGMEFFPHLDGLSLVLVVLLTVIVGLLIICLGVTSPMTRLEMPYRICEADVALLDETRAEAYRELSKPYERR